MISMFTPIKSLLLEDAVVASMVTGAAGVRIHSDVIPQRGSVTSVLEIAGPTLVVQSMLVSSGRSSEGRTGIEVHRLQLDAYASSRELADNLLDAATLVLCPDPRYSKFSFRRVVNGVEIQAVREDPTPGAPTYERDTRLYRRSLDFKVTAARAA